MPWMIYGANGYTGELIAREAAKRGLRPILAGRNAATVEALAAELNLPSRSFGLQDESALFEGLQDVDLVLNCAGPFSQTAEPMMFACIQNKTHYLDITGEISVFELAQSLSSKARKAKIVLCPGVGFDVIPTDCVAARLKETLPDATHLTLGFDSRSGLSSGTAKTTVEAMKLGGRIRADGEIKAVGLGYKTRDINFGNGTKFAVTIPWGDVSTAFHSTGIRNVEVYIPSSAKSVRMMRAANLARPILGLGLVQGILKSQAGKVEGPNEEQRGKMPAYVWGEARNEAGQTVVARVKTANGYSLTITGSLAVASYILMEKNIPGGAYTPSKLMGSDFVERLDGSGKIQISDV
ncbi:saccharopine dehydrogenase NADP-binding domain-containing protein [Limnobacter humi]|uniref:Saccharopine dehydrogenase NADP-binding domain-containing protein n=1 Tax=Limnobacter humi TaxID=1778671 RepID=A0ABT1WFG5_9BURK|nr:saccharopine dehydrogenase NADP-binding domain-containing protein [Limnobacter humi]MCQ8896262.1 saccharopine dehydrogenase NADP-binding domain-containing protein [Limnobacter humi]